MEAIYIPFKQLLHEELPPLFRNSIPPRITEAYATAAERSQKPIAEFYYESLADDQGHWVQCMMHKWAKEHMSNGIRPLLVPNKKRRSHLEIKTSRLLLTSHRVLKPGANPVVADYRASNATLNQEWLPGIPEPEAPQDCKCNMYLLHGPDENDKAKLGFVQLAVPKPRQRGYLAISTLFASEAFTPIVSEDIQDKVTIRLKTPQKQTKVS